MELGARARHLPPSLVDEINKTKQLSKQGTVHQFLARKTPDEVVRPFPRSNCHQDPSPLTL